jgi:uncharacterized protein YjdB
MVAKHILNGDLTPVSVSPMSASTAKEIVTKIKATSNGFEFMSDKYNKAGVHNYVSKADQYLIVNANFDAVMDVEVLASAFNMSKAEFAGHRVLVDGFGNMDINRLNELFGEDEWYEEISTAEMDALDQIPAVIVDKEWFIILDNMYNFTEQYNGEGLYWNYWYHVWKTFSVSPFANSAVFVPGTPSVKSVTVEPSTATVTAGQSVQLKADVETDFYQSKAVSWETNSENAVVDIYGKVTLGADASGEITVTAVSTVDGTKSGTCTITVA